MLSALRERNSQNRRRMVAGLVGCALGVGCGRTSGQHDAGVDQVRRSGEDVAAVSGEDAATAQPDALRPDIPGTLRGEDGALADVGRAAPELDASAWPGIPDGGQDGPARVAPTCSSWALAGPAKELTSLPAPAVRVGERYAVLSKSSNNLGADVARYAPDLTFSWFDPQTGSFSTPRTPFGSRSTSDGGAVVAYGPAIPSAIILTVQGFAIAWTAYRQSKTSAYFALLDATGNALSQPLTLDGQAERVGDVIGDGSQFAVGWIAAMGSVRLARVDSQGNLIGITEVAPQSYIGPMRLFWDGEAYGVFWENSLPNLNEVWFARVDREGVIQSAPVQLSNPDCYGGRMQVEATENGYLVYWRENPKVNACIPSSGLRRFDKRGRALGAVYPVNAQACEVSFMARSGRGIGLVCGNQNAVGFAGLGDEGALSLTPILSVGQPVPTSGGIQVATTRSFLGDTEGFDIFWRGSLDGSTWGSYFTQIRCAR